MITPPDTEILTPKSLNNYCKVGHYNTAWRRIDYCRKVLGKNRSKDGAKGGDPVTWGEFKRVYNLT